MEESVVGELVKGPLGEVFDHQQLITNMSGCGNNWYTVCVLSLRKEKERIEFGSNLSATHQRGGIKFWSMLLVQLVQSRPLPPSHFQKKCDHAIEYLRITTSCINVEFN